VFERNSRKLVYAPCDIKPFPENRDEVQNANLLVIQPGIFEDGLKHGFIYPEDHISRTTLCTLEETIDLGRRVEADQILFVHLEEYWNRSHDDYLVLEKSFDNVRFAYDDMRVTV
jgi:phosphoribosyl 1,2-cyclic phosphate phosphodiesterase